MNEKTCIAKNCERTLKEGSAFIFCKFHWCRLPAPLKREILKSKPGSTRYDSAIQKAQEITASFPHPYSAAYREAHAIKDFKVQIRAVLSGGKE